MEGALVLVEPGDELSLQALAFARAWGEPVALVIGADAAPELDGLLLAPPQAARIAPIVGTERPIMLPRRKKSRRFRRPASSSSM